jgi:hypothetical protein
VAGLLVVLFCSCIGRAAAQPAPKLHMVVVTSEDGPPLPEALLSVLRELFSRVGLVLVEIDEGKDEDLLARVRIQRDEDAATVRVFSVTQKRLASTHRVPRSESDAVFRETVAHVVLGAVEPLVVERLEVEAREPAPAPLPAASTDEAPLREPLRTHFGAALGAGPVWLGDLWGLRIAGRADAYVSTRLPSVFGITLGGILKRTRERASAESELSLAFARLSAGIEPWLSRFVRLGALLSAGVDYVQVSAEPTRMADQLDSPWRHFSPMLGGLLQLRFPLWRGLELQTVLGCDVDLTPYTYAVLDGSERTTLFELGRARPYAALFLAWSSL